MTDEPKQDAEPGDVSPSKPEPETMTAEELLAAYAAGRRDFSGLRFERLILDGKNLSDCDFSGCEFAGGSFIGAVLHRCKFVQTRFYVADRAPAAPHDAGILVLAVFALKHAWMRARSLAQRLLFGRDASHLIRGSVLSGVDFALAELNSSQMIKCDLAWAHLEDANFISVHLGGASLRRASVRNCKLFKANLDKSDLRDVDTDLKTNLVQASLVGAKVRAHTIVDIHGLTDRQKMRLDIYDSLATLRQDYSGFWLWVHLIALALFLSPYVGLIIRATIATAISSKVPESANSLLTELGWFIASGGQSEHVWGWGFGVFVFVFGIVYNGLRGALLYKTHTLLLKHEISGQPLTYVLEHDRPWHLAYRIAKFLFWVNVAVAVWHLILALSEPVVLQPHF